MRLSRVRRVPFVYPYLSVCDGLALAVRNTAAPIDNQGGPMPLSEVTPSHRASRKVEVGKKNQLSRSRRTIDITEENAQPVAKPPEPSGRCGGRSHQKPRKEKRHRQAECGASSQQLRQVHNPSLRCQGLAGNFPSAGACFANIDDSIY